MARKIKYSFKQACEDAGVTRWIDDWDYDKNGIGPDQVAAQSNKKYWFRCHRRIHDSTQAVIYNLTKYLYRADMYCLCKQCNSIGQYIIDTDGEEYLWSIWSDKNVESPFDISRGSTTKRIWLKCLNDETHPDYDLAVCNYLNSHNCPYCAGHRVCETNSLGSIYPDAIELWSEKNNKSPYEYTYGSGKEVLWRCENGIHDDYIRRIDNSVIYDFRCPICGRDNQEHPSGEDHPNWKGGITPLHRTERKTKEYDEWRLSVYERDNYLCQICLDPSHNRLRAHHIWSFRKYLELRFNIKNGITLCESCHDTVYQGSFHQMYGTHNNTPSQLQKYANKRRAELGITEPFDINKYTNGLTPTTLPYPEELSPDLDPVTGVAS